MAFGDDLTLRSVGGLPLRVARSLRGVQRRGRAPLSVSQLDRILDEAERSVWIGRSVLDLYARVRDDRELVHGLRRPRTEELTEAIAFLRDEFRSGRLVAWPEGARSAPTASLNALPAPEGGSPDVDDVDDASDADDASNDGSVLPVPAETDELTWYQVTVVDEVGRPMDSLDVELLVDGATRKLTTSAAGMVRVNDAHASFGSLRLASIAKTRDALRARPIADADAVLPSSDAVVVASVRDDMPSVPLEATKPLTLVLRREHPRVMLTGMLFETNKSFLLPKAMPGIRGIVSVYQRNPNARLLAVGHTDTAGADKYNLDLSLERAEAVADYLTDDVDAWLKWFDAAKIPDKKLWGLREEQYMLSALPDSTSPFYAGDVDGNEGADTTASVAAFQAWSNTTRGTALKIDGKLGSETRRALVAAYMDLDGTSLPPGIALKRHGCGEFFPEEVTSDGVADPANRRVEIFHFDGEIDPPPPGKFSHRGSTEYPRWRKQVTETIDFRHDGLTVLVLDPAGVPVAGADVRIEGPGGATGTTGPDGMVHFHGVPDGTYRVFVTREGWEEEPRTVAVPAPSSTGGTVLGFDDDGSPPKTSADGEKPAVVVVTLPNYWEYPTLKIPETGTADPPRDTAMFRKFVRQIKNDLRLARYLDKGAPDDPSVGEDLLLALRRFKRAASRIFRMHMDEVPGEVVRAAGVSPDLNDPAKALVLPLVAGQPVADASVDVSVAKELHDNWFKEGWVRPVGRFQCVQPTHDLTKHEGKTPARPPYREPKDAFAALRADMTPKWDKACDDVDKAGGSLWGPYGDTGVRLVGISKAGGGSSPRSRHFFGLAVDISQHRTLTAWSDECEKLNCLKGRTFEGKPVTSVDQAKKVLAKTHQRYFVEAIDTKGVAIPSPALVGSVTTFWRIWCRVDQPNALSRVLTPTSAEKWINFGPPIGFLPFPEGNYIDMSLLIESGGAFTRIQAHDGFINEENPYNHTEWWHFSACVDGELPFSKRLPLPFRYSSIARVIDMADLVGFSEPFLRGHNITDTMMEQTTA